MNILVICNASSGLYDFRGMLIEKLIEQGHSVAAIVPIIDLPEELKAEAGLEEMRCRLIHVPMERRGMNPIKDFRLFLRYVQMINREKPDLVITYTIKPNAYGGIACQICRVPYVTNITGLGTAFQGKGMLRRFVTVLYKSAFKKVEVVFFENEENRQIIVNAGIIEKSRTHVLHGAGVDLNKYTPLSYPTDDGETRFLFIGRMMKEKGIDELFEAMRRLGGEGIKCKLEVLGRFDEDYSIKISDGEREGWLKFHGYQTDIRPYIKESHCYVLPSWHEGMANTNLECAASGRPVITSNIHGCLEAVEDGVSGYLCEKQNADSLYKAMKKFCGLPYEERKAMGLAGRKRMEAVFDKKKVVEETIEELMR